MIRGFLLDTNVPSELTHVLPDPRVTDWLRYHAPLYISVISLGEMQKGFHLLAPGQRRTELETWFKNSLLPLVAPHILPVTQEIAERWGHLSAYRKSMGAPRNMADGLIAATALQHNLVVVTRNAKDFLGLDLSVLNPWG